MNISQEEYYSMGCMAREASMRDSSLSEYQQNELSAFAAMMLDKENMNAEDCAPEQ